MFGSSWGLGIGARGLSGRRRVGLAPGLRGRGIYRIHGNPPELRESFVASLEPVGCRYFGRVHPGDTERGTPQVGYVVGSAWELVRFRAIHADGTEVEAAPVPGGLEVSVGGTAGVRTEAVAS